MPIRITDLLKKVDPSTEKVVSETRARFNQSVRRILRDETRLNLASSSEYGDEREVRAVRISVMAGAPAALEDWEFDDDLELALALAPWVGVLADADRGISSAIHAVSNNLSYREDFSDRYPDAEPALISARAALAKLLNEASRADVLGKIFAVRDDVLGVYRYDLPRQRSFDDNEDPNARIDLYWGVIGLVARLLGVSVEALSVKVLAHELAHAYTHVGADADGRRWTTTTFNASERGLKEGLAQYYTVRVLERLGRSAPGAFDAYEKLLSHQTAPYHAHLPWLDGHTPEEVRDAMLTARCQGASTLSAFNALLDGARGRRRGVQ